MTSTVKQVVAAVERFHRCTVISLHARFAVDVSDEVWLVGARQCITACVPKPPRGNDQDAPAATLNRSEVRSELEEHKVPTDDIFNEILEDVGYQSPLQ
ncbi:unnamed protein product, partial [Chrysoparadoxa australica]